MAGLFFCLASAEGAGLLFCSVAIQSHTNVYNGFSAINANYTAHAAKQRTGLYSVFSVDLTYSSAYQIQPPRWTLYSSAQPPYYNNVYKGGGSGVPLLWIHTRQCNISQTMPARRRLAPTACESLASAAPGAPAEGSASPPIQGQSGTLHPAGQSSSRGAAGGAEPLTATAVSLFGLSPDS